MKIFEIEQQDIDTGYYDPQEDKINVRKPNDTRKPILTLKALNRLKRLRAVEKLDKLKREDTLAAMYSIPDEGGDMGGMGGPPGF